MEADLMRNLSIHRERGIALPVMLIMLVVMLVSSLYLFKASNSSTLTTANLAYQSTLSRAADLGLHTAFDWLSTTARTNKVLLDANSEDNGYLATLDNTQTVSSAGFWSGSVKFTDANDNEIEYVIHRMCKFAGTYDTAGPPANACVQTSANTSTMGNSIAVGQSLASDGSQFAGIPQIHYVITARIYGARGGSVINQSVVMIGA
jgi:Tfp pilus assembly protein PilX